MDTSLSLSKHPSQNVFDYTSDLLGCLFCGACDVRSLSEIFLSPHNILLTLPLSVEGSRLAESDLHLAACLPGSLSMREVLCLSVVEMFGSA